MIIRRPCALNIRLERRNARVERGGVRVHGSDAPRAAARTFADVRARGCDGLGGCECERERERERARD